MFEECFKEGPFIFRINENGSGPQLLTQVCLERGWKEYTPESGEQWNLWWRTSGFPANHYRNLYAWQYINHIPKGSSICRKDNLFRYLRCMKQSYGSIYDFIPRSYSLPLEYTKLAAECSGRFQFSPNNKDNQFEDCFKDKPIWICKPVAQSQGRGIFLFRKLSELTYYSNTIVQKYIEKPLLIGGYKFDLRLYVFVPSYHPLTIYIYEEGLVRFGTDKFNLNDLRNPFRHLTNSSINKFGPGYGEMKDRVGSGCKWTLKQLRRYFQQMDISDWLLWQRISSLIILTILSHVAQIPPTVNCFELFGFDVLIDNSLKPWLLEVNLSPALNNDCDADVLVKKPLLHDLFDLLGLPLFNTSFAFFQWNENKENSGKLVLKKTLSVLNAAEKWKRKRRKFKENTPNNRLTSANRGGKNRTNFIRNLNNISKPLPNSAPFIFDSTKQGKNFSEDLKKNCPTSNKWGNGRDWRSPLDREGGWVRVWPDNFDNPKKYGIENINTKPIVNQVAKCSKIAKDLMKNYPNATSYELNNLLQQASNSTITWIPPL